VKDLEKIITSFGVQEELNPKIWDNSDDAPKSHMKLEVKNQLDEIAEEFIKFVNVDMFVQDIIITGSLCNYNWSEYSDVDLHIMYNFDEAGEFKEIYKELFKMKKTLFNSTHDIQVKGYEVELYVQDSSEQHISSGVYSVLFDEWINEPSLEEVSIDERKIKEKVEQWMDIIDMTIEDSDNDDFQSSIEMIEKIKDRLKDYRSAGLEREGEYSYENLVFKFLRRNGYIQKLFDFANELTDKNLSLEQEVVE
jgi:hypothetical protein